MNKAEMIGKGFLEISGIPHPLGGDYTEAHYMDKKGNYVQKDIADMVILKLFNFGEDLPIRESIMYRNNNRKR